jgi:hypothetical protein
MPTLRDKALSLLARARTDMVDEKAGLRRYRVFRRSRVPSDGRGGIGAVWTTTDVELLEKPRVRLANEKDVVRSAGRIKVGHWILDRITPQNAAATVGTSPAFFDVAPTDRGQVFIVLAGPDLPAYVEGPPPSGGGLFSVIGVDAAGNFGLEVVLAPAAGRT